MSEESHIKKEPLSLFISSAEADKTLCQELKNHLSGLQRQDMIRVWERSKITAGTDWASTIDQHLEDAAVILLLISADFLASDSLYGVELQRALEQELPVAKTRVFLVMDNLSVHKGKQVRAWLATHPRFVCHFVPVHCSWMNQIEQWFSILQRKRLRMSDFADLDDLAERIMAFVSEWNVSAHPFNWSTKSVAKVMAKCEAQPHFVPAA
jgi:DDE superfamily endonuclease/TIR domain